MQQDLYSTMATRIVTAQEKIIGPVAFSQADTIQGLVVNRKSHVVTVATGGREVIDKLIESYRDFFGDAAVEVCKEAVGNLRYSTDPSVIPHLLQ